MTKATQPSVTQPTTSKTFTAKAYAAASAKSKLAPQTIQRRAPGAQDVQIEITHCGVCHSDLHQARDEWHAVMPTTYPCVPGHEIIGKVTKVGADVKKVKVGDTAGVGCMVDSCGKCQSCKDGFEQYCEPGATFTYNAPDVHTGGVTYGGYSDGIVVNERFVLRVPAKLDPARAAPLLCAGITTYSPLRQWKVGKGQKVGIVGLGGLGHMGVKFANAMGAKVVVFTTSPNKKADAMRLGAHDVVVSKNASEMTPHAGTFDFILDTVAAAHDLNPYIDLLKRDGTLTQVGAPPEPMSINMFGLIFKRRRVAGSVIGGIPETQEMLDFCANHDIACDIETIKIGQINEAYERLLKGDVKYRFVIDMASMK